MTELIACAVAVVATPPVLFGVEQTSKLVDRRLKELHSSNERLQLSSRSDGSGSSRSTTCAIQTNYTKKRTQFHQGRQGSEEGTPRPCGPPETLPEKLQEETLGGKFLKWIDQVDKESYLGQLVIQQTTGLKEDPKMQTHGKSTRKLSGQSAATQTDVSISQKSLDEILSAPQVDSTNPDVWMCVNEERRDSKVEFQYMFVPARAA